MRAFLVKILAAGLLCVFIFSGWQVYQICSGYADSQAQYAALEQYVSAVPAPPPAPQPAESKASGAEPLWPKVDFEALRSINPETVGWLTIEGTNIHYPVVQGQDNDFYLTHRFDGTSGGAGCLFLDAANDAAFQSANQIVYGHYMKDHSMFYDLGSYKKQDFYDAHPTGWLITPSAAYQLRFFSGYVSDPSGDAWKREFSGAEYVQWLDSRREKSVFVSDTVPTEESRVLTLSTCSYEFEDARFVLHGILEPQS